MANTDGFVRLPNWLIDDSDMSLHELAVYIVLLRFRDPKTGTCFPGMSTIADRARLSRRSVMRAIEALEQRQVIRVTRRSTIQVNQSNVYEVLIANETPKHIWEISARGRRIPRRADPGDSESSGPTFAPDPSDSEAPPSDSETPPSDSQSPPPVTPSHPKKIQSRSNVKNQEKAIRPTLPSGRESDFFFDDIQEISTKQLDYLNDLHVHLTQRPVDARTRTKWETLTHPQAVELINRYWQQIPRGRGGNWEGVTDDDAAAWEHLSERGRAWIDNGAMPDGAMPWAS